MVHEQDVDVDLNFAPADDGYVEPTLDDAKDRVIIQITGVTVDLLVKVAPEVYALYVATNSKGVNSLLVECYNAIYGTMVAGLLYYRGALNWVSRRRDTKNGRASGWTQFLIFFQTTRTPTGLAWWLMVGWWEIEVELNVLVHFPLWRLFWKLYQLYQYTFCQILAGLVWWP